MARRPRRNEDTTDISSDRPVSTLEQSLLRPVIMPDVDPLMSPVDNFLGDTLPHDRREFSFHEPEQYTLEVASGPEIRGLESGPVAVPAGIGFHRPETVAICVRRQQRREVLFAKKAIRKGGRVSSRRHRRWYSDIKC